MTQILQTPFLVVDSPPFPPRFPTRTHPSTIPPKDLFLYKTDVSFDDNLLCLIDLFVGILTSLHHTYLDSHSSHRQLLY